MLQKNSWALVKMKTDRKFPRTCSHYVYAVCYLRVKHKSLHRTPGLNPSLRSQDGTPSSELRGTHSDKQAAGWEPHAPGASCLLTPWLWSGTCTELRPRVHMGRQCRGWGFWKSPWKHTRAVFTDPLSETSPRPWFQSLGNLISKNSHLLNTDMHTPPKLHIQLE